ALCLISDIFSLLQVGNVDALSCYYAHGEQNPSFQRRCFWMLEPAYEHIVLVQYREVDVQSDVEYLKNLEYHPPERLDSSDLRIQLAAAKKFLLGPEATVDSPSLNSVLRNRVNCVTHTISAYDSRFGSSLNPDWQTKTALTFQSNSQGSEITELFDHGHFEPYSREDTTFALGQTSKFNIREISPDWAFSYEITKVIITGDFLCNPSNLGWAVMFGDSEFRSKSSSSFTDIAPSSRHLKSSEDLLILAKFARMLLSGNGNLEVPDGDPQSRQCPKLRMDEGLWDRLIEELKVGCESPLSSVDWILEELLKSKLQKWLSVKLRGFNGTDSISKHDQGIIHLISALGYELALSSVLSVGVGLNFRDSNGWTALHWASYFGR
ncbi:Calmodulin-binding transcription activator 4, partial [Zea mays]